VVLLMQYTEPSTGAVHAVSQCAGQYAKLFEIGELEARPGALEQRLLAQGGM
jgi:hypothetical protein